MENNMEQAKVKKPKANIINNTFFTIKKIYSIDKNYVLSKIIASILSAISNFLYPYILKIVIECIEKNLSYKEMLLRLLVVVLTIFLIQQVIRLSTVTWQKSRLIQVKLQLETSLRSLDIDYEILERPETQDALEKCHRSLNNNTGMLGLFNRFCDSLYQFFTFMIASVLIIFEVNILLVIAIIILSIIKVIIENKNQKRRKKEFFDVSPPIWRKINYSNSISTNLTIAKDLRIYDMDEFINYERDNAIKEYIDITIRDCKKSFLANALNQIISIFDSLLLYGFMIYAVLKEDMAISTFTFMVSSVFKLINSLYNLIVSNSEILYNSLQINDYRKFMDIDYKNPNQTLEVSGNDIEIEFKNVYFSYYMQEDYALEDVSFKIKAHEKIALVGYNGAGKTTIVKLLSGLYKPTKGQILINGIDITKIKQESLAKIIAPVFQETIFFPLTVEENIAMKINEKYDSKKILDIIKLLKLEEKINSLPLKVKSILSRELDDDGIELSGGENQKLSLARAMYKNGQVFILDEPTSALDAISEYEMYNNFNDIVKDHTTIFISHRLSSTKFCDRIILLDKGKVIEIGTHDELMELNGKYAKLFNMQAKYYQNEEEKND